jgi:hypothetical protein
MKHEMREGKETRSKQKAERMPASKKDRLEYDK